MFSSMEEVKLITNGWFQILQYWANFPNYTICMINDMTWSHHKTKTAVVNNAWHCLNKICNSTIWIHQLLTGKNDTLIKFGVIHGPISHCGISIDGGKWVPVTYKHSHGSPTRSREQLQHISTQEHGTSPYHTYCMWFSLSVIQIYWYWTAAKNITNTNLTLGLFIMMSRMRLGMAEQRLV